MPRIDHNELTTGKRVWYKYDALEAVFGPFTVLGFFNDHEGRKVQLGDRHVLLADDEDFGALSFFDSQP